MSDLLFELRHTARALGRQRGFAATAVVTLALGIGGSAAIFGLVNAVLLTPPPYRDAARLVAVTERAHETGTEPGVSAANFVDWAADSRTLQLAAFRRWGFVLTGAGEPERLPGARVSADLFATLGVTPVVGRLFLPEEDRFGARRVVLLRQSLWERRFGADPTLVGRTLVLNGEPHAVIGVLPSAVALPDADLWVPLALEPYALEQRGSRSLSVIGRLRPDATLGMARAELRAIERRLGEDYPAAIAGWDVVLRPLRDELVGAVRPTLLALQGAVGLVLLIACANLAHLSLARATRRSHELAVRAALGAGRLRLFRQAVAESLGLAVAGGAAGLLLAQWGTAALVRLGPPLPPGVAVTLDGRVLGFTLLVSLAAGLSVGVPGAAYALRSGAGGALRPTGSRESPGGQHARLRDLLVSGQVALAVVLLFGAGLLANSFVRVQAVRPGFQTRNVLSLRVSLPEPRYPTPQRKAAFFEQLLQRLRGVPGVESAALVSHPPLAGPPLGTDFAIDGRPVPASPPTADYVSVSPEYFRLLNIPLIAGRPFATADGDGGRPVVIVSEQIARAFWPGEDPLGRRLVVGATIGAAPEPREIVGVVGDVRASSLEAAPRPTLYVPHAQNAWPAMTVLVRTAGDPMGLAATARAQVLALDPDQPVDRIAPFDQLVRGALSRRRFQMLILTVFAGTALALAAMGVYGINAYAVARRTREIGIRAALGATRARVLGLVVRRSMAWALGGIAIGAIAAAIVGRAVASMLYGVAPTDPATFLVVACVLAVIALTASYLPARRATRVNPVEALRHE
jgi:putative ABC transport system permease protein